MKYKFFIRLDGVIFGPYSLQEYHDLDVPDDTEVMEEGVGEWYYASDFPSYEELNARENGYKLMPDGSIEKIKEKQSVNVEPKIPSERCGTYDAAKQSQCAGQPISNYNKLYWPLIIIPIAIVPRIGALVSFCICILLGLKGNEWAWKSKAWDSAEHFNNVQHRWAVAAGIYCIIVFVFIVVGITERWHS